MEKLLDFGGRVSRGVRQSASAAAKSLKTRFYQGYGGKDDNESQDTRYDDYSDGSNSTDVKVTAFIQGVDDHNRVKLERVNKKRKKRRRKQQGAAKKRQGRLPPDTRRNRKAMGGKKVKKMPLII